MAVLITGGMGYIGSHTVVELLNENENVIIIDDLSNSNISVLDKIEKITKVKPQYYNMNIIDKEKLRCIFNENKIEAVIHFAGFKAVGESVEKPLKYYSNNLIGLITLCEVMKEFECKKIIFSSSATVYGINNKPPFVETMELSVVNPYGATKLMSEQILQDLYISDNEWSIVILRYFNPIGAHKSGLIGEKPNGIPNNLLPYILQVAQGKLDCVHVYGNDYDTKDGTGVRDYLHVVDLAKGHFSALNYMRNNNGIQIFNLGTGKGYSVLEVINTFEKVSNKNIKYKIVERRKGDVASSYANAEKAKIMLDWEAKCDLEEMCRDSWRFNESQHV